MAACVLIYASRLRVTPSEQQIRKKFEEERKKFLTNDFGYANIAKLLKKQRAIETPQKKLKKLEKSS